MVKKTKLFHQEIYDQVSIHFDKPDELYILDRSGKFGKIVWSEEQKEHIFDLHFNKKVAIAYISHKFNVNHETIRYMIKDEGKTLVNHTTYKQVYSINHTYFNKIDTPDKAYWLGMLYADGSVIERQHTIKLYLQGLDITHVHKFKIALETDYPFEYYVNNNKGSFGTDETSMCGLRVRSKQMFNDLCKLGCTPRKTHTLKFPTEEQVPREFVRDFIRGFTDGDGSINYTTPYETRHYAIEWGCASKHMLDGIHKYFEEQGFNSNAKVRTNKKKNKYNINFHKLGYSGNILARDIINHLYYEGANTYLWRKQDIVWEMNEYFDQIEKEKESQKSANELDNIIQEYYRNKKKNKIIGEIY